NKVNLLLGEWTDLLAVNADRTNQLVLLEHRYCEYSPCTAVNDDSGRGIGWWNIHVILFGANIGDMDRMFRLSDSRETGCRPRTKNRPGASLLRQPRRRTVQCGDAVLSFPLPQVQHAELGLAEPRRVRQYGLEHGLQVAGRARDDAQHLIGRRLPLLRLGKVPLRLGELTGARFELLFQLDQ